MNSRFDSGRGACRGFRLAERLTVWAILLVAFLLGGCGSGLPKGIQPVADFDADRYLGTWYEIACLDHFFQRGMQEVSAT